MKLGKIYEKAKKYLLLIDEKEDVEKKKIKKQEKLQKLLEQ